MSAAGTGPECMIGVLVLMENPVRRLPIVEALQSAGYRVIPANDGRVAARQVEQDPPGMVIIDMRSPGAVNRNFIRNISLGHRIPVVLIAEQGGRDVERAFAVEADECITDPLSREETLARLGETLRRRLGGPAIVPSGTIRLGTMRISSMERTVTISGRAVQLSPMEFSLLWELASNAGSIMSQDTLIHRVWGQLAQARYALLRTTIKNLRRNLGDDARAPRYIVTVKKAGYRMGRVGDE